MNESEMKFALEAVLMTADTPLSVDKLQKILAGDAKTVERDAVKKAIDALREDYAARAIEIAEVANGFRVQSRAEYAQWVNRQWEQRKPRYSRALMETLAIIAYRQPITRGEIENIRGVAVSTNIVRTLMEREWVRIVGHRDVPGRPAIYATSKEFLDYFGLKSLEQLPSLAELRDFDDMHPDLFKDVPAPEENGAEDAGQDGESDEALDEPSQAQEEVMDQPVVEGEEPAAAVEAARDQG
ncbi:MAG: SMC-Scp complex subunit ScpB [Pseudomonadota bacterium]